MSYFTSALQQKHLSNSTTTQLLDYVEMRSIKVEKCGISDANLKNYATTNPQIQRLSIDFTPSMSH